MFLSSYNRISLVWSQTWMQPDVMVHSDASGLLGCAVWWNEGWFLYEWSSELVQTPIMPKETLAIVLAQLCGVGTAISIL